MTALKKEWDCDEDQGKRLNYNSKDASNHSVRSISLLEKLRSHRGVFDHRDAVIIGPCILCNKKLSLSWYDWKLHLIEHTDEKQFWCTECNVQFALKSEHTRCPDSSIIDIFGEQNVGDALDGFICELCDFIQINDYRLMEHFNSNHKNSLYEIHVSRVNLVPNVRPHKHIIQTDSIFIPQRERYRCGIGYCIFHGNTMIEYSEHLRKAHRIFKTFYCPHCKLLINRMVQATVAAQNVLNHIESHGSNLHQCFYCEFTVAGFDETEIRTHIADKHTELQLKLWHNVRGADDAINSELIEIVLDCSLCGERVNTIPSVFEHFKQVHVESEIDFNAIKLVKATTKDLKVTCSVDDSGLHYSEVTVCGLCTEYFSDKHNWLNHFAIVHPNQELVMKRDLKWLNRIEYSTKKHQDFDRNMLFFCKFCENSNGVKLMCSNTVDGVYNHWDKIHKRQDMKPFQFYMAELVACNYCKVLSTFNGLKEHVAKAHPNEIFVALKSSDDETKQCALCEYSFDELTKHFESEHTLAVEANVLNPVPLNQYNLLRLLQIWFHKKIKCEHCDKVFEMRKAYRTHHSMEHINLDKLSRTFFDRDTIKLIGDCCHMQIEPNSFHDHLKYHKYTLQCEICKFRTTDAFNLMTHKVNAHNEPETVSTLYLKFLQLRYWRSELIFGNGLVLNKFNTQGTDYDYTRNFERFAARLVDEKMHEYKDINKKKITL